MIVVMNGFANEGPSIKDYSIEDISKIRVTRGTQIVQTMESNSSSKSYIHIYSKMFYEDWRTGSKIIKIDVFNRDIKDFKNFIDSTFTYSKEWMFRYADPFKIDQVVGFIYAPFISSNQLNHRPRRKQFL